MSENTLPKDKYNVIPFILDFKNAEMEVYIEDQQDVYVVVAQSRDMW